MPCLLIVGNTNHGTFVNAILAAQVHAKDDLGLELEKILVLNSTESEKQFGKEPQWRKQLAAIDGYAVNPEIFTRVTVEFDHVQNPHIQPHIQLDRAAHYVEDFLRTLDHRDAVYVDLTNGTSHYKTVLANIAYIIGTQMPYFVNRGALPKDGVDKYWTLDQLKTAYTPLPAPSRLDRVAPVWLTDVRRFHDKAERAAEVFERIANASPKHPHGAFLNDIRHAIDDWFRGERASSQGRDNEYIANLDGAIRSLGIAFESLVNAVYLRLELGKPKKILSAKLNDIRDHLAFSAPDYDTKLFEASTRLLRELRNSSVHDHQSAEFARVRVRLASELLFSVTDLFGIAYKNGFLTPASSTIKSDTAPCAMGGTAGETYFFGLDGDDTGRILEQLFQEDQQADEFKEFSRRISCAMKAVSKEAKKPPFNANIVFQSGDDLLFRGTYDADALEHLRGIYRRVSGNQTCSVGFGRTPKEAYIALKMAKARPGKDSVMGIAVSTPLS